MKKDQKMKTEKATGSIKEKPGSRIHFANKPGLVAYVTCGDPDMATTKAIVLAAIRAGADVIELGVPFSDPVADGPVIQRASERALRHGTSLMDVLHMAAEVRKESDAGMIIFSYLNPVLRLGIQTFCRRVCQGRRGRCAHH